MTGFMLAGRGLGLVDPPSPEAVVSGALEKVDLDSTIRTPARTALVAVLHPFYGAAVGAVFELVMSRRGEPSAIRGGVYGLAVWALGYLGWLPGFGILPSPSRQGAGRHVVNVSSHLVYGCVLGVLSARSR